MHLPLSVRNSNNVYIHMYRHTVERSFWFWPSALYLGTCLGTAMHFQPVQLSATSPEGSNYCHDTYMNLKVPCRLQCSSFLAKVCCLIRGYNMIPKKQHRSLQVGTRPRYIQCRARVSRTLSSIPVSNGRGTQMA